MNDDNKFEFVEAKLQDETRCTLIFCISYIILRSIVSENSNKTRGPPTIETADTMSSSVLNYSYAAPSQNHPAKISDCIRRTTWDDIV